jgi:hypothetical protein
VELLPLRLGDLSEELEGVFVEGLLGPGMRSPSGRREADHVRASVVGVSLALHVASPFEIVDQGHKFWNAGENELRFVAEITPALDFESLIETMFGLARTAGSTARACRKRFGSP